MSTSEEESHAAAERVVEELWVETDGFGRCRLNGNAHTFPGRIDAWSDALGSSVTISASDVKEASPAGWAWIDGFLAGSEPQKHEFLGVDALTAGRLEDDDPAHGRYRRAIDEFRAMGAMPFPLMLRPTFPPPPTCRLRPGRRPAARCSGGTDRRGSSRTRGHA